MRQAPWDLAAELSWKITHHLIKSGVRLCAIQQFDQMTAKRLILLRRPSSIVFARSLRPGGTEHHCKGHKTTKKRINLVIAS